MFVCMYIPNAVTKDLDKGLAPLLMISNIIGMI